MDIQLREEQNELIVTSQLQEEITSCIELTNLIVKHSCHSLETDVERVDAIMLMRMLRDLRCIQAMVSRGYLSQAASLAAGLVEQLGAVAIVAGDDENAKEWRDQPTRREKNKREHFPSKSNMGKGTCKDSKQNTKLYNDAFIKGLVGPAWSGQDASKFVCEELASEYRALCEAKHADPIRGIGDCYYPDGNLLVFDSVLLPDDLRILHLRRILGISTLLVNNAYLIYIRHHSAPEESHMRFQEYRNLDAAIKRQILRSSPAGLSLLELLIKKQESEL